MLVVIPVIIMNIIVIQKYDTAVDSLGVAKDDTEKNEKMAKLIDKGITISIFNALFCHKINAILTLNFNRQLEKYLFLSYK